MKHTRFTRTLLCLLLAAAFLSALLAGCSMEGTLLPPETAAGRDPASEHETEAQPVPAPETERNDRDDSRTALDGILLSMSSNQPEKSVQLTADSGSVSMHVEMNAGDPETRIAPGTDLGVLVEGSIKGTAEQAATLQISISEFKDLFLHMGTYPDYTELVQDESGTYGYFKTFRAENGYAPGRWELTATCRGESISITELFRARGIDKTGIHSHNWQYSEAFIAAVPDLLAWIEARNPGLHDMQFDFADPAHSEMKLFAQLDAGAELDLTLSIRWEWPFEGDNPISDQADTLLGNYLSGAITELESFDPKLAIRVGLRLEPAE